MAESLKAPTLSPCNEEDVQALVKKLVNEHHQTLDGAAIQIFWLEDKPRSIWGGVKVVDELTWWLARTDLVLKINRNLFEGLSNLAKQGLIDHFLSGARAKEGGQTKMETEVGARQLYQADRPSLSIHPQIAARNRDLLLEIPELAHLVQAIVDPEQFLLDFNAPAKEAEAA